MTYTFIQASSESNMGDAFSIYDSSLFERFANIATISPSDGQCDSPDVRPDGHGLLWACRKPSDHDSRHRKPHAW